MKRRELLLLRTRAWLGDLEARHTLGAIYATGDHDDGPEPKNEALAARWYLRAARRDHAESQYDLGWMLLLGEGVSRNAQEALHWLHRSAEAGHSEAMRVLSDLYSPRSDAVPTDERLSAEWSERLAAHLREHPEDRRGSERDGE